MAVSYVKFFQTFAALDQRMFLSEHPAAASALRFIRGMSSEQARTSIHALYRRHADDVLRVLADGMKEHSLELVMGQISARSILSMCSPSARVETSTPSNYDGQMKEFIDSGRGAGPDVFLRELPMTCLSLATTVPTGQQTAVSEHIDLIAGTRLAGG